MTLCHLGEYFATCETKRKILGQTEISHLPSGLTPKVLQGLESHEYTSAAVHKAWACARCN